MIIVNARAILMLLSLIGLVAFGELPWWVLMLVVFYQVDYQFRFWLPGAKAKMKAKLDELLKKREDEMFASMLPKNIRPEDIN